jgi:transposase
VGIWPTPGGNWRGRESIKGGRANLRSAIYLPSLVATRHNTVALTAIMRKLVLLANALLRDNRRWTEKAP